MRSKAKLDKVERQIIAILQENGRETTAEMARKIDVVEPTIRRKLNRLLQEGIITVRAVADPVRIGFSAPAFIGLDVDRARIEEIAEKLCLYPMIEDVVILTGPYDILVRGAFESTSHLYEFVLHELASLEGIRDTQSFLIMRNFKFSGLKVALNDRDESE
jgi:Lrp/AsnC family transcriptional regulator for asnA, asnC and gidA